MRSSEWVKKVGRVFNVNPRNGTLKQTVWLPRRSLESSFREAAETQGVHICLDGPTGTGKSSLALTGLHSLKFRHTLVQVTNHMSWPEFCRQIAGSPKNDESSLTAEASVGIDKGLPKGDFRVALGAKSRASDDLDLLDKMSASWTEHDVCKIMAKEDITLFIDDFELAKDDLVIRVADMCKILTESYVSPRAKLVIVGTGDIYRRIYKANESLEGRIREISLGTLPRPEDSWKFLQIGFEALKLRHPANDRRLVSSEENVECMKSVYRAADGLLKSLTELGNKIATKGFGRPRVSPSDVLDVASIMPLNNYKMFRREFPQILGAVEQNPTVRAVLEALYQNGIGQIHHWDDLALSVEGDHPVDQIESAIGELVATGFLIQTGRTGDVLFAAHPPLAHTLCVVASHKDEFHNAQRLFKGEAQQLSLPLFGRSNHRL